YVATVVVLMERRNTELYNAIMNVRRLSHLDLIFQPLKYMDAVVKYWVKSRISVPDSFLSMCLVVPLLPAYLFEEAEKFLRDVVAENRWQNEDPNILSFLSYLHTTWLRYSKHVSVYECESLTTDGAESFHRHNKIKLGGRHPCIWTLSDGIEKILIDEEINYKRLLTTAKPPKRRTPQYVIDRLNYVNNLKRMISKENQKFDVATYLKMMPKSIEELLFTLKLIIGNDIDFITNDDSVPHELDIPKKEEIKGDYQQLLTEVEEMIPPKSCNPFKKSREPINISPFFPTQSSASKCQVSQSSKIPTKFSNPSLKNKEKAVKNSPLVSPKFTQVMTISGTKYKKPPSSTVTSHSLKIPQKPDNTTLKKIKLLTATPLVLPKSNEILMSSVTNNRKPPSSTVTSHSLTIPEKPDNPILKENKPFFFYKIQKIIKRIEEFPHLMNFFEHTIHINMFLFLTKS
ncbi:Protein of unknown function, partial [Cotesia congregata]